MQITQCVSFNEYPPAIGRFIWYRHHFMCVYARVCLQTLVCMHMQFGLLATCSVIAAVSLWLERWLRCWLLAIFGKKQDWISGLPHRDTMAAYSYR